MPRTGTNCIQLKDGRYRAALNGHGPTTYYYGATRQEALQKRREAERRLEAGQSAKPQKQTLKAYLEEWLETCIKPPLKSEGTYRLYEVNTRVHLIPALGKIPLESLTPAHLRKLYAEKRKTLSPRTIVGIHSALRMALGQAVKDRILRENVASLVEAPTVPKKERVAFGPEQAKVFLQAIRGHTNEALFATAILYGVRSGELVSMKWSDIDFDRAQLIVRGTKTETSRYRPIPLIPELASLLRRHKAAQQRDGLRQGRKWSEDGPVFANAAGEAWNPRTFRRQLSLIVKHAGLPQLRVHDLRHSCATLLFALGVDPKIIQAILGHANIHITLDLYTHLLPEAKRDAVGKLSALFGEDSGT